MLSRGLLLALVAYVAAQSSSDGEPCEAIASAQSSGRETFPAKTAFDCLNSVPVDLEGNAALIDELKEVWKVQSEHDWLKNPGEDWEYGALDIDAELNKIKKNLGSYRSEYAVQLAIQNITIRTGNFHFNYRPDILSVFQFERQFDIASISSNGTSLPKLYVYQDVKALADGRSDVSEFSEINGQDPYDFLKSTFYSQYIDSDGQMNAMFATGDTESTGVFASQAKYDGPYTNVTWANGTTKSFRNTAITQQTFRMVIDGPSFFSNFCTGLLSGASITGANKNKVPIAPRAPGPIPRIPSNVYHLRNKRQSIPEGGNYTDATVASEASSGAVAGYFLSGNGYDDVAVLKIISFSDPSDEEAEGYDFNNEFQTTVKEFLAKSIRAKKQKLIIDLRENGGGDTSLLLDTFMQLFPDMEPFSGQRYRATDAWIKIGNAVNEIHNDQSKVRKFQKLTESSLDNYYRYWAWWEFRTAEGDNFDSWDQFNGPLLLNSDNLTVTMRYNYSNTNDVSIRSSGFDFTNATNRATPFSSENVVMFTDAMCGSSCASFHEELKNIAGVRAVTVGGRPENKPIQTITGTKGGEVVPLIDFPKFAFGLLNISSDLGLKTISATDATLSKLANSSQIAIRAGDSSSRAQSQDQIRKGDSTGTPLQFIYEASDCRIFYTPVTFSDPDAAWKQAFDAWQNNQNCVAGSTGHKSSISGGYKPFGVKSLSDADQPDEPASGDGASTSNSAHGARVSGVVGVLAVAVAALMM
ncbi:hypothetical protein P153DRAFT_320931 [Dothidotthia symphoricarpi CBS 119687]|uniref:Uncharacterized protein n=1 Tax=Dothidotthia symphoricarpi CBS 119687 TaxID=1392245 RepID=A0A6A6A889_9PLEO|nr:uncharacterized protein P153DRAFT_320931 [Dothidotthia symphoricarpi CBS 119687]KAF2127294.1 hypothetical protein P153DRAFT_320931 [Dothidotthia symphoricarpi CBS 119687]